MLTLIELSCAAAGILVAGHELGHERLVGGGDQDRSAADHEGEHEQKPWRHLTGEREGGERGAGDRQRALDRDQQPAPVEGIGQDAPDDAEHHVWEHVGGLDERDEDGGVGGVDKEPLGADRLHPGADVADEGREPQPPEDRAPKGGPCGRDCLLVRHDLPEPADNGPRPSA